MPQRLKHRKLSIKAPRPPKLSKACELGTHYHCYVMNCTCGCHKVTH